MPTDHYSGANKVDLAANMIAKGLLENNMTYYNAGKTHMEETMLFSELDGIPEDQDFDGIREDYSFQQHNTSAGRGLLYTGGYGQEFIHNIAFWGAALRNGGASFNLAAEANFFDFLLEGYRWMLIGNTTDYSANGRYIARRYPGNNAAIPASDMNLVIDMVGSNNHLRNRLIAMRDNAVQIFPLGNNNKYFWLSDYVSHHEGGYFSSVRMCSSRTIGTESVGHENKLGYWLPYGCTFIYREGDEYIRAGGTVDGFTNIFPLWDWTKIPGVTCPAILHPFDDSDGGTMRSLQNAPFVGSTGNGRYSVTTMDLNKNNDGYNFSAKKAWFHFGTEIIALGAGITGGNLSTTINQSLESGGIVRNDGPVNIGVSSANTSWIHHDNIAYIFPGNPIVNVSNTIESGTTQAGKGKWELIENCEDDTDTPNINECAASDGQVFKAWIDHGSPSAQTPGTYQYIIYPNITTAGIPDEVSYYNSPNFVVTNTPDVQAVVSLTDGLAGIVYYPPGNGNFVATPILVRDGVTFSTNLPCAVLYDGINGEVCISAPNRVPTSIILTVALANVTENITFNLPAGTMAGTSTCMNINFAALTGRVRTHCEGEAGINTVQITGQPQAGQANIVNTNVDGVFSIPNNGLLGVNYTLTPFKNTNPANGVSGFDRVMISRHILQTEALDSPYKMIAADANRSGGITSWDNTLLGRIILGTITEFPNNTSWRFVDAAYTFPNPNNPFAQILPEVISLMPLRLLNQVNFTGIKTGDVNCSTNPGSLIEPCEEELFILAEEKALRENDVFTYALRTENFDNIAAYQFALRFDASKLQYQNIQQGDLNRASKPENFNLTTTNTGLIRTLWLYNEASNPAFTVIDTSLADYASLFLIQFKALQDIPAISDVINLSADDLPGGAWSDGEDCTRNVIMQFMPEGFADNRTNQQTDSENPTNNIRVYPNPTSGALVFEITTDTPAENTIQIYSTTGQQVLRQIVYLEKGNNTIPMENISNWQDGLYFYTITDASGLLRSGKFVKN
jgi:chondroitin AC lyase